MPAKSIGQREIDRMLTDCDRMVNHILTLRNQCDPKIHAKEIDMLDKYGYAILSLQESLKDLRLVF